MKRLAALALLASAAAAPVSPDAREAAYRANNRGVALLEQYHANDAVAAFREALALDPELALGKINLAIALLNVPDLAAAEREARVAVAADPASPQAHYALALAARGLDHQDDARAAFRRVLALDPADAGTNVNLGQLLMQQRVYADAVTAFRTALAGEPYNVTATYNLGLALTRSGQAEEGQRVLERFRALRDAGYGTVVGTAYPEQGRYAAAVVSTGGEPDLVETATPAVHFSDATDAALAKNTAPAGPGRITLFDFDGDGTLDLFVVSAGGQRLYRNESGRFVDVTTQAGLDPARAGVGAVGGDLDNDGRADLLVLREHGVTLLHNDDGKRLSDATVEAGLASAPGATSAVLADFDHDGDLDVLLGGNGGPDRLLQNAGDATFKDVADRAGLIAPARVLAAVGTDYDNGRDMDLFEVVADAPPRLYRNLRDGSFKDVAGATGLAKLTKLRCLAAADVNKDSFTDFFFGADDGDLLALSDGKGHFRVERVPWGSAGSTSALFLDYDNDGQLDLLTFSRAGVRLLRNVGSRFVDVSEQALGAARGLSVASVAAADLDGDGATDLVLRLDSGALRVLRNGGSKNHSLRVRVAGLVSNKSGVGAKIEMRAGSLLQKIETQAATPATAPADVVFGLGARSAADAVRVLWPSGTLQAEFPEAPAGAAVATSLIEISELNRKPSSCPYLYAWNGAAFLFVTDFMGSGEMGDWSAPRVFNTPNPLEYVRVTDEQLRPRDGRLELRVTNELEEALFVDRLALYSVDHPKDVEIYPNQGMTDPPKPVRFFAVRNVRAPRGAVDDGGRDVLASVARLDRRYPDAFALHRIRGYAAEHSLTLDLGPTVERAALLLTGWTDYAFSSDNVAAHQSGLAMRAPRLEVEDDHGAWQVAIPQVGIPVGRPQTVVADLTGIWRGASRRVRLVTNMRVYWDCIRVADVVDAPPTLVPLASLGSTLRQRGFSAEVSPDGREPHGYDYGRVVRGPEWKTFPGRYTREGDVGELLRTSDDVFVLMRPGDELALSFGAGAGPRPGWRRTFLLQGDGFSKEMDINSATPDALLPLPFHGMSRYPYAPPEAFPMTEARRKLFERYNTRIVGTEIASR